MRTRTRFCTLVLITLGLAVTAVAADRSSTPLLGPSGTDCNGNGIDDAEEIALDPVLDANFNGKPDYCEGLSVDRLSVSLRDGGEQRFLIDLGPNMAGSVYWILGTTAGTDPGFKFGFAHLPLNHDGPGGYFSQTLKRPNEDELSGTLGILDKDGRATGKLTIEPETDPTFAGQVVHHSFVILYSTIRTPVWASNAVSLELLP